MKTVPKRGVMRTMRYSSLLLLLLLSFISSQAVVKAEDVTSVVESEEVASGSCTSPGSEEDAAVPSNEAVPSVNESISFEQVEQESVDETLESEDAEDSSDEEEEEEEAKDYELMLNVFGKPQKIEILDDDELNPEVLSAYEKSVKYMTEEVYVEPAYEFIRSRCRNYDAMCTTWAAEGGCDLEEEIEWMIDNCSPACGTCEPLESMFFSDEDQRQLELKLDSDEDEPDPIQLGEVEPIFWGIPQNLGVIDEDKTAIREVIKEANAYMEQDILEEDPALAVLCENKHKDCSIWASMGLCEDEDDEEYMEKFCAPACNTCDQILFKNRCPIDPEAPVAFEKPGELNAMFERIVSDAYWEKSHGPLSIISSPATTEGPWIVTLDKFLTDEECDKLIQLGHDLEFDVSEEIGETEPDGTQEGVVSEYRTSTNSWCQGACYKDPTTQTVQDRIEKLVGIPESFYEHLQLLRYEPGQYYQEHHDWHFSQLQRPPGPRVLTVFLYLNDVEAGGGTFFNDLNVTVVPKKGRMVIWPSVPDEDPQNSRDDRTHHEALAVEAGMKFGANAWVHLRDFKTADAKGCS